MSSPQHLPGSRQRVISWAMHCASAGVVASLAGCASCPPFKASWYLIEPPPTAAASAASQPAGAPEAPASAPAMYLALLHEGRHEARLTHVMVNPMTPEPRLQQPGLFFSRERTPQMLLLQPGESSGPRRSAQPEDALPGGGHVWKPGQLLVFEVTQRDRLDQPAQACSVPVTVQIECGPGCRKTQAVSGSLPNYLRDDWIKYCQPLKPSPQGGKPQGTP